MSEYIGFIPLDKYLELKSELCQIADIRGLENALHHLYQPDTDMNDKVCEDFEESKRYIIFDLLEMMKEISELTLKITDLKED